MSYSYKPTAARTRYPAARKQPIILSNGVELGSFVQVMLAFWAVLLFLLSLRVVAALLGSRLQMWWTRYNYRL